MLLTGWPKPNSQLSRNSSYAACTSHKDFTCMYAENVVLPVQTVVLFNGEEITEWTFSSGVFRTT